MKPSGLKKVVSETLRNKKSRRRVVTVIACFALVITLVITGALPGLGYTKKVQALACHVGVHTHTETCYNEKGQLICGRADYVIHTHNESCVNEDGEIVCQLPEILSHVHTEECYELVEVLTCVREQDIGHVHTAECYEQRPAAPDPVCGQSEHTHSEDGGCYALQVVGTETVWTCKLEENTHEHNESCYAPTGPGCGVPEEHKHDESCYDESGILTCEKPEHEHDENCYLNSEKVLTCQETPHTHIENKCYTVMDAEEPVLICSIPEHTHTESCYNPGDYSAANSGSDGTNGRLICGHDLRDSGHIHSEEEGCYSTWKVPTCQFAEEHDHVESCYKLVKLEGSAELQKVLICGKPEAMVHEHTVESCFTEIEVEVDDPPGNMNGNDFSEDGVQDSDVPDGSRDNVQSDGLSQGGIDDGQDQSGVETGAATVTFPDGTTVTPEEGGTVTAPAGSKVTPFGSKLVIVIGVDNINSATVDAYGAVTLSAGDSIKIGDTTITLSDEGTVTPNEDGTVTVPDESTVIPSGNKTEIVIGNDNNDEAAVDEDGVVAVFSGGGSVKIGNTTVTLPGSGTVMPNENGTVTVPKESTVTPPDSKPVIVIGNNNDATVDENGIVTIFSSGGSVKIGNTTVTLPGGGTVAPNESGVTVPGGSIVTPPDSELRIVIGDENNDDATVNANGAVTISGGSVKIGNTTVTLPGGGTVTPDESGVTVPNGSIVTLPNSELEIVIGDDNNGQAAVKEDGSVTLPGGGSAKIGNLTVTVPEDGGTLAPDNKGGVIVPGGSTVKGADGIKKVPEDGGIIDKDGTYTAGADGDGEKVTTPLILDEQYVDYIVYYYDKDNKPHEIKTPDELVKHLNDGKIGVKVKVTDTSVLKIAEIAKSGNQIVYQFNKDYFDLKYSEEGEIVDGDGRTKIGVIICEPEVTEEDTFVLPENMKDNIALLTFDEEYISSKDDKLASLMFQVEGVFNVRNIVEGGHNKGIFKKFDVVIGDDTDEFLSQYSNVKLDKFVVGGEKNPIKRDGDYYYIEYMLKVTAGEFGYPNVVVTDSVIPGDNYRQSRWLDNTDHKTYSHFEEESSLEEGEWKKGTYTPSGGYYDDNENWVENTLTWNVGTLKDNESRTLTYRVYLNKDVVDKNVVYSEGDGKGMPNHAKATSKASPAVETPETESGNENQSESEIANISAYAMPNINVMAAETDEEKLLDEADAHAVIAAKLTLDKECDIALNDDKDGYTITYWIYLKAPEDNPHDLDLILTDKLSQVKAPSSDAKHPDADTKIWDFLRFNPGSFKLYEGDKRGKTVEELKQFMHLFTSGQYDPPYNLKEPADIHDSMELEINNMEPGKELTIVYTVNVDRDALQLYNGNFEIKNDVSVDTQHAEEDSKNLFTGKHLADDHATAEVTGHSWSKKMVGPALESDKTISFGDDNDVYYFDGNEWKPESPEKREFNVPAGGYEYTVTVNEYGVDKNGQKEPALWDVSSWTMEDELADKVHMQYVGYAKVEAIDPNDGITVLRTAWVNINDGTKFTFNVGSLGFEGENAENCTFRLTYYAVPVGVEDITKVSVRNNFNAWPGEGGEGDGLVVVPPAKVKGDADVIGSLKIRKEKQAWYYDPTDMGGDYSKGTFYWILETIANKFPENVSLQDKITSNNHKFVNSKDDPFASVVGAILSDHKIDFPATYGEKNVDGFVNQGSGEGIRKLEPGTDYTIVPAGNNTLNIRFSRRLQLEYSNVGDDTGNTGADDQTSDGQTSGDLDQNDQTQGGETQNDLNQNDQTQGVEAQNDLTQNDQTQGNENQNDQNQGGQEQESQEPEEELYLYFVVKSAPTKLPSEAENQQPFLYTNELKWTDMYDKNEPNKSLPWSDANYDYIYVAGTDGVKKEYEGQYYTDGEGNITNREGKILKRNETTVDGKPLEAGLYITWKVKANIYGDLKGEYELVDTIPEISGDMEVVSVTLSDIKTGNDSDVTKMPQPVNDFDPGPGSWSRHVSPANTKFTHWGGQMAYYLSEDGQQVKWRVDFPCSNRGDNERDMKEASAYMATFVVTCRVTDDNVLRGSTDAKTTTYFKNRVDLYGVTDNGLTPPMDWGEADTNINNDPQLTKAGVQDRNVLHFKIIVNPFAQDLDEGDTITLEDHLSEHLILQTKTIGVYTDEEMKQPLAGWNETEGEDMLYIFTDEDEQPVGMLITVPDEQKLYIGYDVQVNVSVNSDDVVAISNKVGYVGRQVTSDGEWADKDWSYRPDGIATYDYTHLTVHKRNTANNPLKGAKFRLTSVEWNEESQSYQPITEGKYVFSSLGESDANGDAIFTERDADGNVVLDKDGNAVLAKVKHGVVYCLEEYEAPDGYLIREPYYFVILGEGEDPADYEDLLQVKRINDILLNHTLDFENRRGSISGTKKFIYEDGEPMRDDVIPTGEYVFGLYRMNENNELEKFLLAGNVHYTSSFVVKRGEYPSEGYTFRFDDLPPGTYYVFEMNGEDERIGSDAWEKEGARSDTWERDTMTFVTEYDYNNSGADAGIKLGNPDELAEDGIVDITNIAIKTYALPKTGGEGIPSALYVVGGLMAAGAGVLLVLKKRMARQK